MNIYLYSFESCGEQFGTYYTQSYREAKKYAEKHRLAIIENIYEWQEGVQVESFEVVQLLPCTCDQCEDEDRYFEYSLCERRTPWCRGLNDGFLNMCDACAAVERGVAQ